MSKLVDPGEIPAVQADVERLETVAGWLQVDAARVRSAGLDVSAAWSGLAGVYHAPEGEQLVSALRPVAVETDQFAGDVQVVAAALSQFAGVAGWLRSRLLTAQFEANALRTRAMAVEHWDRHADLVAENNRLVAEVDSAVVAYASAERECANRIEALVGGASWHAVGSGGPRGAADPWVYGPASIPEGTQMPWGAPVEVHKSCVQSSMAVADALNPVGGGAAATAAFGRGELDAITGMAAGVEQLVDVSDWATFKASWAGMAALGGAQGQERQAQSVAAMAKGMVASDEWATDPARAGGTAFFNVGSLFLPGGGEASAAGHAAEGASLLAKAAKTGDAAGDLGKAAKAAEAERLASELRAGSLAEVEATDKLVDAELAAIDRMPKAAELQNTLKTKLGDLEAADSPVNQLDHELSNIPEAETKAKVPAHIDAGSGGGGADHPGAGPRTGHGDSSGGGTSIGGPDESVADRPPTPGGNVVSAARTDQIIDDAAKGNGNFGLGSDTREQTLAAGEAWVGNDARLASDGKALVSRDGLRQFRPPAYKAKLGKWQANFESRPLPKGRWLNNGHVDVMGLK
jgi:hypothetical protein